MRAMRDWLFKVPAAVVATGVIMGFIWKAFLASSVIASVTEAVAGDIEKDVQSAVSAQLAPVAAQVAATNVGVKATIQSTINQLEDDIAALEFRQNRPDSSWSQEDMQRLTNKRRRLREQQDALSAIQQAESQAGQ